MKGKIVLAVFCTILVGFPVALAQLGTQHGVNVSFTPAAGSAGSNVYRCLGVGGPCTAAAGTWVKINSAPVAAAANVNCTPIAPDTTCFLDTSSLNSGSQYSYAATDVDSSNNESVFSNVSSVTFVSVTNPNPPTGCNTKNQ